MTRVFEFIRSIPKTVFFNLRYLPFHQAVCLPIFVSHRVWLKQMGGSVSVAGSTPGTVRIGFGDIGIFDRQRARSIWEVRGAVEFSGRARLGHGCKVSVKGKLVFGDNVQITAETAIVAHQQISFGRNVLVSWDVLIMDTDLHVIRNDGGKVINSPKAISIGDSVWIGCSVSILKGVKVANGVIIGAATTLTRSVTTERSCVGGSPPRVLKEHVTWEI
ncbi:acyltransferase [Paraburkholderia sediminicola]|jgi:carbonic anhydrase/acetyltransferase-like protein (isoleucine patch superfamily)|uniref:acyltransferase n=1 Tax=Paraburkholderia sediminicola TaxID=458836 RepID=UPI00131C0BE0